MKGFLIGANFSKKENIVFEKMKLTAEKIKDIKIDQLFNNHSILDDDLYFVPLVNGAVLCFTNLAEINRLKFLSAFSKIICFDLDLDSGRLSCMEIVQGVAGKTRSEKIQTDHQKSILSFLFKSKKRIDYSHLFTQLIHILNLKANANLELIRSHHIASFDRITHYKVSAPKTTYISPFSKSTNATPFSANMEKIMKLMPSAIEMPLPYKTDFDGSPMTEEKYGIRISEQIRHGVVSPALLIQKNPICLSVYSSDMDAVIFLKFEDEIKCLQKYKILPVWSRFIAVNMYSQKAESGLTDGIELDIIPGENNSGVFKTFIPIIANFVVKDYDQPLIKYWEDKFDKKHWEKVKRMTLEYSKKFPGEARFGNFMLAQLISNEFIDKFHPHLNSNN